MIQIDFHKLNTLSIIAKNFNTNLNFLNFMYNLEYNTCKKQEANNCIEYRWKYLPEIDFDIVEYMRYHYIPKKNKKSKGKFREVIAINEPYNLFYKTLLTQINIYIQSELNRYISDYAYGFIIGRNTISNAKIHLNKKYILKLDIKNFFESIQINEIEKIFIKLGFTEKGAKIFSRLCTYNNKLKEGLATSPLLSNLVCYDMDIEFEQYCNESNLTYTRYVDDITISSNEEVLEINDFILILKKYGFELNIDKTYKGKKGQSQYVTGLSISNEQYPRIPRAMKHRIRQILYQINKFGFGIVFPNSKEKEIKYIYGHITYILGVEKNLGLKLKRQFEEILNKNGLVLSSYMKRALPTKGLKSTTYHYFDESELEIDNKKYLSLCCCSIDEFNKSFIGTNLNELKEELLNDSYTKTNKKRIFHFNDDIDDIKFQYIENLRNYEIEAFISYIPLDNYKDYSKAYYKLLNSILEIVVGRYYKNIQIFYYENNSKIKRSQLELILDKYFTARSCYKLTKEDKTNTLLSLPDYILGISRKVISKNELKEFEKIYFERIRNKLRVIIDIENKNYYSREKLNNFKY